MKPSTVLATLLAGIAAGMGVYGLVSMEPRLFGRGPAPADGPSASHESSAQGAHSAAADLAKNENGGQANSHASDSTDPSADSAPHSDSDPASKTADAAQNRGENENEAALTRDELLQRAAKVEQEANHELARLIPLLNLTEEQQDQVFMVLAARSKHFVPGMLAEGRATAFGAGGNVTGTATVSIPVGASPGTDLASDGAIAAVPSTPTPAASTATAKTPNITSPLLVGGDSALAPAPITPGPSTSTPEVEAFFRSIDTSLIDSLLPFLDTEQQDNLVAEETDRAAWWNEVLTGLMGEETVPEIDGSTDNGSESGAEEGDTMEEDRPDTLEEDRPSELGQ